MIAYKNINQIIEESKDLITAVNKNKEINQEVYDLEWLAVAGMLSYYGMDCFSTIYYALSNATIDFTHENLSQMLKENSQIFATDYGTLLKNLEIKACLLTEIKDLDLFKRGDLRSFDHHISITDYKIEDPLFLLEDFIHEFNHLVNSVHTPIYIKNGFYYYRCGLLEYNVFTKKAEQSALEEVINTFQTHDIRNEISDVRRGCLGYESIRNEIQPLYLNSTFKKMIDQARFLGHLDVLGDQFDYYTVEWGYYHLWTNLDKMLGANQREEYAEAQKNVSNLVKRYQYNTRKKS